MCVCVIFGWEILLKFHVEYFYNFHVETCLVLSCLVLSCLVLSCLVWCCLVSSGVWSGEKTSFGDRQKQEISFGDQEKT